VIPVITTRETRSLTPIDALIVYVSTAAAVLPIAEAARYTLPPGAGTEETRTSESFRVPDPTADVAINEERLALSTATERLNRVVRTAARQLEDATREVRKALRPYNEA
jgi:hypothetical protein